MIEWIRERECAVALDSRPHPVLIASWHGVATVELVDRFYRWTDSCAAAALAAEQQLIRIADLTHARPPAAHVTKRALEHARNDLAAEVTLALYVAVEDPILRRIVTAMRWTAGGRREPEVAVVGSMASAIELALDRLRTERIPLPAGLDPIAYRPPRLASSLI
jgi:hypothetical protein